MKFDKLTLTAFSLLALSASAAFAESGHHKSEAVAQNAGPAAAAPMSEGTVKKVDKSAGKVTIAHGPLANLDMPSMTMVFKVKDPAMLDQVKSGDKIRFAADKVDGAFTVTQIEVTK